MFASPYADLGRGILWAALDIEGLGGSRGDSGIEETLIGHRIGHNGRYSILLSRNDEEGIGNQQVFIRGDRLLNRAVLDGE